MIFLSPSKGCNLWDLIDQILIYYTIKQLLGRSTDHFRWINWWLACCSFYRCSDIFCLIHGYSDIFDFSSSIQFDIRPPFFYKKLERIIDVHSPLMHLTAQSRSLNWLYVLVQNVLISHFPVVVNSSETTEKRVSVGTANVIFCGWKDVQCCSNNNQKDTKYIKVYIIWAIQHL